MVFVQLSVQINLNLPSGHRDAMLTNVRISAWGQSTGPLTVPVPVIIGRLESTIG